MINNFSLSTCNWINLSKIKLSIIFIYLWHREEKKKQKENAQGMKKKRENVMAVFLIFFLSSELHNIQFGVLLEKL